VSNYLVMLVNYLGRMDALAGYYEIPIDNTLCRGTSHKILTRDTSHKILTRDTSR
jgi:hypothetical protein